MEKKFDDTPEVAPQNFPEVAGQQQPAEYGFPQYQAGTSPITAQSPHSGFRPVDGSTVYGGQSPYQQYAQPVPPAEKKKEGRKVCGCALLVFILSCIIAVLSAAVIGLVASTAVEANRANDYQSRYENATRTTSPTTTSTPAATSTPFNSLTNGCTDNPDGVTNTNYTSFQLLGPDRYTMYCNRDTPNPPLMGMFAADFSTCMDACSSWTKYVKDAMTNDTTNNNVTCAAVSFIPLWTNKSRALAGGAPGNCYLKAGPQNETGLLIRNIGTEVHAAVLDLTFNGEA